MEQWLTWVAIGPATAQSWALADFSVYNYEFSIFLSVVLIVLYVEQDVNLA